MTTKIAFVLELTRDEALTLVLLNNSAADPPTPLQRIAAALEDADQSLGHEQYARWVELRDSAGPDELGPELTFGVFSEAYD